MKIILIKSINKPSLEIYKKYLTFILKKIKINFNIYNLPIKKKIITLLQSPHVYKKSLEHFEIKSFKTIVLIRNNISTSKLNLILINKPKTINLQIKTRKII